MAVQVERLKEDIKTFAQQHANDQKRQKDRYQGLPLQLNRFEKELQSFVQQVKKETAQRERLTERIEALGDLSLHVDGLTSQFASFRGELELVASLTRAEADQKRKAGNQVGRVEGPIENLLHEKKREYLQREAEQERRYTESKAAFEHSLDDPYKAQTWEERRLVDVFQREYPTEANSLRTVAVEKEQQQEQERTRDPGPSKDYGPSR